MVGTKAEMGTVGEEEEGAEEEVRNDEEEDGEVEEVELSRITGADPPLLTNPSSLKGWSNIMGSAYVCVAASDSMYCSTEYGI